eukprot:2168612-Rhodomonas_salina.1
MLCVGAAREQARETCAATDAVAREKAREERARARERERERARARERSEREGAEGERFAGCLHGARAHARRDAETSGFSPSTVSRSSMRSASRYSSSASVQSPRLKSPFPSSLCLLA